MKEQYLLVDYENVQSSIDDLLKLSPKPDESRAACQGACREKGPGQISGGPGCAGQKGACQKSARQEGRSQESRSENSAAKAAASPADKALVRAKTSLAKMGKNRPTKLASLLRHLKSIVGHGATDAAALSHRLETANVIQVVGDLVSYS